MSTIPDNNVALVMLKDRIAALESENARLRTALVNLRCDCRAPIDQYERNGPSMTARSGEEYEPTSYVLEKMGELISSIDTALR